MSSNPGPAKTDPARAPSARRVLLLAGPAPLLLRMGEIVRSVERVQLVGSYTETLDVVDWAMWDREGWHLAYVDLTLPGSDEAVRRLLATRRPGVVVGVVDHLWREVREEAAKIGVHHIVEKGDLIALRDDLERRVR
jgi:hypothetical protein